MFFLYRDYEIGWLHCSDEHKMHHNHNTNPNSNRNRLPPARPQESNPDQDCHVYALLITAVIFVDITSAILPLISEYSFSLVRVRDLGLGI